MYYCSDDKYFRTMHGHARPEEIPHSEVYAAYRRQHGPVTRSHTRFAHMHMQLCECMESVGGRVSLPRVLGTWSTKDKVWYLSRLPMQM